MCACVCVHLCAFPVLHSYTASLLCVSVCPETKVFYRALSQVGTDFTMMTLLVEGRTRGDLKVGGAWMGWYMQGRALRPACLLVKLISFKEIAAYSATNRYAKEIAVREKLFFDWNSFGYTYNIPPTNSQYLL